MKTKILHLTVLLLALMLTTSLNAQTLTNNLLYYLPIIGNADDVSGNGYHATSTGTLTTNRMGVANSAYEFNGSGQTIVLPNLPQLKPQLPMSVSFYAWFDVLVNTAFSNDLTPSAYTGMWIGTAGDGTIHLNYGDGGTTSPPFRRSKSSAVSVTTGTWHHYVGVIRDWNDMDIYIDCVDAGGAYSGSGGSLFYSNNPGQIGIAAAANQPGGVSYMAGKIDEIAFWDRALTPSDVLAICKGSLNDLIIGNDEGIAANDVEVYPNPTTDRATVKIPAALKDLTKLQVIDFQGKILQSIALNGNLSQMVSMAGLAKGLYFLRLSSDEGKQVFKKLNVI